MSRAQSSGVAALLSDYRRFAGRRLWVALGLMVLGALAEGLGLLMIVPLASIAINGVDPGLQRLAPWIANWSGDERFVAALIIFIGAMAARSVLLLFRDVALARLAAEYEADLRLRAAATLADRGWPFASRIGQAGMQVLLLGDVPRAAQTISFIQNMVVGATMLAVALVLTTVLSPKLTLVAAVFLILAGLVSVRLMRRGVASGFAISDAMGAAAGSGFRLHAGLKAALAQGTVPAFLDEYRSTLERTARQYSGFVRDYSYARNAAAFGAALAAAILLLVGVRFLALPFPVLVASLVLFARMSGPAQILQTSALQAAAAAPAFAAIEGLLGKLRPARSQGTSRVPLDWQRLQLDAVAFEHQSGLGLRNASLAIERGAWVGIRGPSGAGKTTLVDLAAGLLVPESGAITVDGARIDDDPERWRAAISYVAQEGIVFSDSVRGNLLAEGADADDVELWRVLEVVGLGHRVRAFAAGLNEQVGDRGSQLSGGERQRLVLARALLRKPSLLILDEATSALDPESEAQLIQRLKGLEPRPAALVVAHRESTLSHCDSVVSIQHGTVHAAG